jgi:acyl-coenzyme A synthetase/AMP-(fatty) acid ligase
MTDLVERVLRRAGLVPSAVALVEGRRDRVVRYGELRERVLALRDGLAGAGLRAGDGVVLAVRPGAAAVVAALGVVAAGGTLVMIDPGAGPEMFAARLRLAGPRWIVAESALFALNRVRALRGTARRRGLLLPGLAEALPGVSMRPVRVGPWMPGVPRGALSLARLTRTGRGGEVARDPYSPAVVVFTSGTTARPRGVVHSAASLAAGLDLCRERLPLGESDIVHDSGFMLGLPALAAGALVDSHGDRLGGRLPGGGRAARRHPCLLRAGAPFAAARPYARTAPFPEDIAAGIGPRAARRVAQGRGGGG